MLLKTAFSSLLVLLIGCEHREPPTVNAARPPAVPTVETTSAPVPAAAQDTSLVTPRPSIEERAPDVAPRPNRTLKQVARLAYVCPMHPEVILDAPGDCPKCNMKLEPKPAAEARRAAAVDQDGHAHSGDGQ